jgi:hypothetical protein
MLPHAGGIVGACQSGQEIQEAVLEEILQAWTHLPTTRLFLILSNQDLDHKYRAILQYFF